MSTAPIDLNREFSPPVSTTDSSATPSKKQVLEKLLRQPAIWRGETHHAGRYLSTGHDAIDKNLPGNGWRLGSLTEILCDQEGIGELRLIMPALAELQQQNRWIVWVAPPYIPYAPALVYNGFELSRFLWINTESDSDGVWAIEQVLNHPLCGAAVLWTGTANDRDLRRMQIAAESSGSWAIAFRPMAAVKSFSPAATRVAVKLQKRQMLLRFLKCRGGREFSTSLTFAA
ncbi:MAG: translesion DNA synthesis-associated protein ImuA [Pseudomonadota bacterium]